MGKEELRKRAVWQDSSGGKAYSSRHNLEAVEGVGGAAKGRWNAAALAGIHCAISCVDARTVKFLGQRSRGERHADAAELLKTVSADGAEDAVRHFLSVIGKNAVECDARPFRRAEFDQLELHASRFFRFARTNLA